MHKIIRAALLLFVLASTSALCFAQRGKPSGEPPPPPAPAVEYNPNAWKELASPEGRFSVRMPAEPKLNSEEVGTAFGKIPARYYTATTGVGGYMAGYSDFPKHSEEPQFISAVLDGARDKVLAADAGRKLLGEQEVTVEGFPAREWLIADKSLLFRAETFLAQGRFYQLLFVAPLNVAFNNGRASANAADRTVFYEDICRRFFGSFRLLPASAATGAATQPPPTPGVETQAAPADERVEGEVDKLLKSLREKREPVFGVCEEGAKCPPLPDIEGVTAEDVKRGITIKVLSKPQPAYPPIAKAARAQGTVKVQVLVDEEGKVIAAQALSGHPLLQAAAVKAARGALFSPVLIGNKPVKLSGVITYNFVLQ